MNKNLNINLLLFRKQNKLTQGKVAEKLGVSQQSYAKYEQGLTEPDVESLMTLSKLYNVSVDELLGNDSFIKTNNFENMLPVPAEKRTTVETLCKLPEDAFLNVKGQIEIYAKYYGLI